MASFVCFVFVFVLFCLWVRCSIFIGVGICWECGPPCRKEWLVIVCQGTYCCGFGYFDFLEDTKHFGNSKGFQGVVCYSIIFLWSMWGLLGYWMWLGKVKVGRGRCMVGLYVMVCSVEVCRFAYWLQVSCVYVQKKFKCFFGYFG